MERLIFHVDVNSAFLSWEAMRRVSMGEADIRLIPSCVGGDPDKRTSVVVAKSVPAKKYNIITGEPVSVAIRKCPGILVVKPDFALYERCSKAFKDICREYAPAVEEFSIDECFLDMTGTELIYPDPVKTAYEIKDRIKNELGFTVNIGIGNNKLLAKMAGDFEKPDKVHTLFADEIESKMWPLPVSDLLFVGKASVAKLKNYNIKTIGDLANVDIVFLKSIMGEKGGEMMHAYANGIDDSPVCEEREDAKGYSVETTLEDDVTDSETAYGILLNLADSVATRLRVNEVKAGCVAVTIRGNDMKKHSHQKHLKQATDITKEIYEAAKMLFDELWDRQMPMRLLGIALTDIDDGAFSQMSIFGEEKREKEKKVDKTMDELRLKFGTDIIMRGTTLQNGNARIGRKFKAQVENNRDNKR
ncbi:MAG: DNA polymerase thumb domain-containing protein [Lachnospira sp.]